MTAARCSRQRVLHNHAHSHARKVHSKLHWKCLLLFLSLLIQPGHSQRDTECVDNLYVSDADGDRRVDSEEYVTFVQLEGPEGFLPNVDSFVQLPIMLQSNFYTLSCLCRSQGGGSECCVGNNAHLNASGTAPDEIPTDEQANYLNVVCGLTSQAIDLAVSEQTDSPTEFSVSDAPSSTPETAAPTEVPSSATLDPTTAIPTESPSTMEPTITFAPSGFLDPSMVLVRTTYSILVPNGRAEDVPISSYELDLILAMDTVALAVAVEVSEELPVERKEERQNQRLLDNEQLRRRLQEIVVTLPTKIVEITNVGFTSEPQLIGGIFVRGPCPRDLGDPLLDLCQEVTTSIELDLSEIDADPLLVYGQYLAALDRAILEGKLGAALPTDSPVEIASGQESQGGLPPTDAPTTAPTPTSPPEEKSGLSAGAIAGISAGGLLLLILLYYAISSQREHERRIKEKKEAARKLRAEEASQKNEDDPEAGFDRDFDGDAGVGQHQPVSEQSLKSSRKKAKTDDASTTVASTASISDGDGKPVPKQSNLGQQLVVDEEEKRPEEEDIIFNEEDDPAAMLAATVPYINSPTRDKDKVDLMPRIEIEGSEHVVPNGAHIPVESRSTGNVSHESEAGWSEAYTSSMGSVSDDELLPDAVRGTPPSGQQMVSILPDSPLAQGRPKGYNATAEDRFEALESAIVAGDWAAVGATAAALASMQDSQSRSEISKGSTGLSNVSSLRSQSWKNKIDTDKADQLDQLIERGDWEGIILAAANFEAEANGATNAYTLGNQSEQSSYGSNGDLMVHEDGSDDEDDGGDYYTESNQSSRRSSRSSVPSQKRSRDELRAEILALVEEVVPEEVDHVDEMMEQFAGREQELIETLMTMQERAEAMNSANGRSAKSIFKGKM